MRFAPILLSTIYCSTISLAFAGEPAAAPAPAAAAPATANAAAAPRTDNPPAPLAPTAVTTTATAPTSTTTAPPASEALTDAQKKEMFARGYKLKTHKGQPIFCKSEAPLGSHIESETCTTYADFKKNTQDSQDYLNQMQTQMPRMPTGQ
jgi:hypothetical protein